MIPTTIALQSDTDPKVLAALVIGLLLGLGLLYFGFKTYRISRLIKNTPPEKVRSAAVGRTELHGTAVPKDYIFEQPFTDGECLYADIEVEEYREYNDEDRNDEWVTIFSKTLAPAFYLDDGTGRMLVDADSGTSFEIGDENSYSETVRASNMPSEQVQDFLGGTEGKAGKSRTTLTESVSGLVDRFGSDEAGEPSEPGADTGGDAAPDAQPEEPAVDDTREVEYVTRGEMNGRGAILELLADDAGADSTGTDSTGAESTGAESTGGDDSSGGLVGTLTSTASAVSDVVETASGGTAVSPTSRRKRRYNHEVLPVGSTATVFGAAEPRDADISAANEDRLAMTEDPSTDQFIVTDRGEEAITWGYTKRAAIMLVVGLAVSAGSVGGLAYLLGL